VNELRQLFPSAPDDAVLLARRGPKVPRDPKLLAYLVEHAHEDLISLPVEEQAEFWQWCPRGRHPEALTCFSASRRGKTGYCLACDSERVRGVSAAFTPEQRADKVRRTREWREANPEKALALELKKYGLTVADYYRMLDEQNGVCKACGEPESRKGQDGEPVALHIDHCHETGRVRGLLCNRCNMALGYARESVKVLAGLINYIEGWPA
jgi:hypothetical protein